MRRLALESQGAALLLEIVIRSTLDQFLLLFLLGREHDLVSGGVRARQHVVNHLNTPSRFGSLYIRRPALHPNTITIRDHYPHTNYKAYVTPG